MLVCDHRPLDSSEAAAALYATDEEQHAAFSAAGFAEVRTALVVQGMYLCVGVRPPFGE